jgi:hypothetical protein
MRRNVEEDSRLHSKRQSSHIIMRFHVLMRHDVTLFLLKDFNYISDSGEDSKLIN